MHSIRFLWLIFNTSISLRWLSFWYVFCDHDAAAFVVLSFSFFIFGNWTRQIINDFSIDFTHKLLKSSIKQHSALEAANMERKWRGLNFPIRQLDITIKHFPQTLTIRREMMKFLLPLCFSAQHTTWMSRSCMFDYVLTIFFCRSGEWWKFSRSELQTHNARN